MRELELRMQRRQIAAIIDDDAIMVTFVRELKVPTTTGSWRIDGSVTLLPQRVTLIPFLRRLSDTTVDSQFGEIPNVKYILMGRHDLDVQVGDSFTYAGERVRVDAIDPIRDVRTSCAVVMYG